ncbi:phosphotransferase family protein [Halovenus rubra]|uniref:Phosphotransferase family protein n=2 Tax=Halovenus rubra TaxID=869890 RepID=A0ABD5XCI3_9EURY|nr:phosphotransferase [Halovenus rubra]
MREEIRDRLDAEFDSYGVVAQLHDVPPHEVYEVTVDGDRAVCKLDTGPTGSAGMEGRVTAFVGEKTTVPVPAVFDCGRDYYVAAWHPDAPEPEGEFDPDERWATAAGRGMAQLHEETAHHLDGYGQFQLPDDKSDCGSIATTGHQEWHAAALDYVRHYRPTLEQYGHADIADDVIGFLQGHPDVFAGAGEPVCCHGWATPEHVAVQDGEVACLVDFEHAIAAPGEFDYWRTVMPAFGPDGPVEAFRTGYESVRSLSDDFADRQQLYVVLHLVYFFESLYVQNQHTPVETDEIAQRLRSNITDTLNTLR